MIFWGVANSFAFALGVSPRGSYPEPTFARWPVRVRHTPHLGPVPVLFSRQLARFADAYITPAPAGRGPLMQETSMP